MSIIAICGYWHCNNCYFISITHSIVFFAMQFGLYTVHVKISMKTREMEYFPIKIQSWVRAFLVFVLALLRSRVEPSHPCAFALFLGLRFRAFAFVLSLSSTLCFSRSSFRPRFSRLYSRTHPGSHFTDFKEHTTIFKGPIIPKIVCTLLLLPRDM
jgi:hypothetical protein